MCGREDRAILIERISERFFRIILPIPSKPDALFVIRFVRTNSILVSPMCICVQISFEGELFVFRARGLGSDSF